ncbi:MAG: hypothetical protein ACLFUG_11405 [Nitriliruptoraceae bacterium]
MTYRPNVQVRIGGALQDPATVLEPVEIVRGRQDVQTQPQAGHVRVQLLDLDATADSPSLTSPVTIEVDDGSGTMHRLFTGTVTDVRVSITSAGDLGRTAIHEVRAVGPLGQLHRGRANPDGYPAQLDGDRVAAILEATVPLPWEVAAGTWDDQDATWDTFDPPVEVDRPGRYHLAAVTDDTDPWQLVQTAAQDGLGQLGERRTGGLTYTASRGRLQTIIDQGYTVLPPSAVAVTDLASDTSVVDLVNEVTVEWSGGAVTVRDDQAVLDVGAVLSRKVTTTLDNADDAQARAERLLRLYSRPARSLDELRVAVDGDNLTPAERAVLYDLDLGTPIRLDGLPAAVTGGRFSGFVEGVTWTLTRTRAVARLVVSDYRLSEFTVAWGDLGGEAWADTDATVTWNQAQELTDA